jgi:hypothetical protein
MLASEAQLVEVTTDTLFGAKRRNSFGVAAPAIALELAAVPKAWGATLMEERIKPNLISVLNLSPGDIRELTTKPVYSALAFDYPASSRFESASQRPYPRDEKSSIISRVAQAHDTLEPSVETVSPAN